MNKIQPILSIIASLTLVFVITTASTNVLAFQGSTRLTNVPINDNDVGAALTNGLTREFEAAFPQNHYGVRVIVDRLNTVPGTEIVYISVGISHRLPDGRLLAQHANASYALALPAGQPASAAHSAITQKLAEVARLFAQQAVQNQLRLK
jgi:hypothetical protein